MKNSNGKYFNFRIWLLLQVLCIYPGIYYALCQSYHSPISIWTHLAFLLMRLFYTVYTFLLVRMLLMIVIDRMMKIDHPADRADIELILKLIGESDLVFYRLENRATAFFRISFSSLS